MSIEIVTITLNEESRTGAVSSKDYNDSDSSDNSDYISTSFIQNQVSLLLHCSEFSSGTQHATSDILMTSTNQVKTKRITESVIPRNIATAKDHESIIDVKYEDFKPNIHEEISGLSNQPSEFGVLNSKNKFDNQRRILCDDQSSSDVAPERYSLNL